MLRKPIPPAKSQLNLEDERPPPLPKRVATQPGVDSGAGGGEVNASGTGQEQQAQMPIAKPLVKQRKGSQLMSPVWGGAGPGGGGVDGGNGYFASRAGSGASQGGGADGMREVEPRPVDEDDGLRRKPTLPVRETGQGGDVGGDGVKGSGNQGLMDRDDEDAGGLAGWEVLTPR